MIFLAGSLPTSTFAVLNFIHIVLALTQLYVDCP